MSVTNMIAIGYSWKLVYWFQLSTSTSATESKVWVIDGLEATYLVRSSRCNIFHGFFLSF